MPVINKSIIQSGEPAVVNTINIDDLLGDKLTAFAPNTVGVKYSAKDQYGRPKCTEIIKQLYDCAYLANCYEDIERVKDVYKNICSYQIRCGTDKSLTIGRCLLDTIRTCELLLANGYRDKEKYSLLMEGMINFNDYKIGDMVTIFDIQKYALSVDIVASKILKKLYPLLKQENKYDYFIRTNIKEKELKLIGEKEELEDFYANCLWGNLKL